MGRGRHTCRYITLDMATRHLHTFRATRVHSPAVLRRDAESPRGPGLGREDAEEGAARLEALAAECRGTRWAGVPHPTACRCHDCLTAGALTPG